MATTAGSAHAGATAPESQLSQILERQNSAEMSFLVKAMMTSHRRAQRLGTVYATFSVALAVAGFVSTFVEPIAVPVTLLGALWAIAHSAGLASWTDSELRRAAILQEMFDTRLYGMPWNQVAAGDPIETQEV